LAADYASVIDLEVDYIAKLSGDERRAILQDNPFKVYSLQP
jgi:predicted TIM-barrel fold metal-dependent hydrolase